MHIKKDNVEYWKSLIPTIKNIKFQFVEDLHFKNLHDTIHTRGGNPTPKVIVSEVLSAKV